MKCCIFNCFQLCLDLGLLRRHSNDYSHYFPTVYTETIRLIQVNTYCEFICELLVFCCCSVLVSPRENWFPSLLIHTRVLPSCKSS